jgi:hypothetical protein
VFLELQLVVGGGSWIAMKRHIRRLDLDTSHWDRPVVDAVTAGTRPALPDWSEDELRSAFADAHSLAEVMRRLGLDPLRKRGRRQLERRLEALDLDPRALPGQKWAKGTSRPVRGRPIEELLVRGPLWNTSDLKRRLLRAA